MSPPEFVSTEPCDVQLIDTSTAGAPPVSFDDAILAAIEAIRETTSREQAIAALESLVHSSLTAHLASSRRQQSARALAIADQAMFNVLTGHCIPGDLHHTVLGFADITGCEVSKLHEADPQILEAFEWLRLRGYVHLAADGLGDHIIVTRRPGE